MKTREEIETILDSYRLEYIFHTREDYMVLEIACVFTKDECREIISFAKNNGLNDSGLVDKKNQEDIKRSRISKDTFICHYHHPLLNKLSILCEELTGRPVSHQEKVQIVEYQVGGKFLAHYDACNKKMPFSDYEINSELRLRGSQRESTLILYLNDECDGGETTFPFLNITVKPSYGKVILFPNLNNSIDQDINKFSLHQGCMVQ